MGDFFKAIFTSFSGPVFLGLGLLIIFYTFQAVNVDLLPVLALLILFGPIWIPVTLFFITYDRWMEYVHLKFEDNSGRITLEIKLPQEVFKSPQAMEEVLTQAWNNSKPTNLFEAYWDGKYPLTYSLEIVSTGGDVRFYANVPIKKAKNLLESQLYAQYPGIEITEVPVDYTAEIKWDPDKWQLMSFHFGKKDAGILPIRTYVDMGLDKLPKEEEKIEPMAPLLEHMANCSASERIWFQILAIPHAKQNWSTGSRIKKDEWTVAARKKINELMQRDDKGATLAGFEGIPRVTEGERELTAHIERNSSKAAYETAIRVLYAAPPDVFNGERITAMIRALAGFEVIGRNGLGIRWRTDFDYNVFSDFSGKRKILYKKKELDYYKMRFYLPFDVSGGADAMQVFSVEELATIWHIPGKAIVTPGVGRVESLRQDAPANLPTSNTDLPWT